MSVRLHSSLLPLSCRCCLVSECGRFDSSVTGRESRDACFGGEPCRVGGTVRAPSSCGVSGAGGVGFLLRRGDGERGDWPNARISGRGESKFEFA